MKYLVLTLSILCLSFVIYDMSMWIIICNQTDSFEEAKALAQAQRHDFFKDATKSTLLNIFLATLAGIGFLRCLKHFTKLRADLLRYIAALAFFLASWQLFSLM